MNNSEVLDVMISRLGNRKNFPREELLRELNLKIEEKERGSFLPWFLESVHEVTITPPASYIELPADFLREFEGGQLELVTAAGYTTYPVKRPYEVITQTYKDYVEAGVPGAYAIYAGRLYLAPRPDVEYLVSLPYIRRSTTVLDDNSQVTDWLANAFNFIIYATLVDVAANNLKDDNSATKFANLANSAFVELYKYHESRQHTNADYNIGDE